MACFSSKKLDKIIWRSWFLLQHDSWFIRNYFPILIYLDLSRFIVIYRDLSWFVLIWLDLTWFVLICLDLSWFVLICLDLSWFILIYLDSSRFISIHLDSSWFNRIYLDLDFTILLIENSRAYFIPCWFSLYSAFWAVNLRNLIEKTFQFWSTFPQQYTASQFP